MSHSKVSWRGVMVCSCIVTGVEEMFEPRMRAERGWSSGRKLAIYQGCYSGAVSASGGTHDLGGALDTEKLDDAGTLIARECGTTSWQRGSPEDPYFSDHNHWIWNGCPDLSWAAEDQVDDYKAGRNGLVDNGPDKSPRPDEIQTWQDALDDYEEAGGVLGMTHVEKFDRGADQTFKGEVEGQSSTWKTVKIDDDGNMSLVIGPCEAYWLTIGISTTGLPPGAAAQFKVQSVYDYSDDRETEVANSSYPTLEVIGTDGGAFGLYVWGDTLTAKPPSGAKTKLRLFCNPPAGIDVVVTQIRARVFT